MHARVTFHHHVIYTVLATVSVCAQVLHRVQLCATASQCVFVIHWHRTGDCDFGSLGALGQRGWLAWTTHSAPGIGLRNVMGLGDCMLDCRPIVLRLVEFV
jgi:hypothetical protein